MPIDIGIWDAERPPRVAEAQQQYEHLRQGRDASAESSPRVTAFVEECGRRWPTSSFTTKRSARGLILTLDQENATELYPDLGQLAEHHGLVFYDAHSGMIRIPSRLSFNADPPKASPKGSLGDLLKRRRRRNR